MIVGRDILASGLIVGGEERHLKHSTYDLTIGEIVPIGKKAVRARRKDGGPKTYYIEPREMVWVLSKEEFRMPAHVTGMATLKTSSTKLGLLALNVGIIDPLFTGPISTALINFSDKARRIDVGERFFRVAFFKHDDVSEFHPADENTERDTYIKHLENVSYTDFSPSFLNIPDFDDDYYFHRFWMMVWQGIIRNKIIAFLTAALFSIVFWYLFETGLWTFLKEKWALLGSLYTAIKWW
jgi:deoxycytidine triphosphate deaminase